MSRRNTIITFYYYFYLLLRSCHKALTLIVNSCHLTVCFLRENWAIERLRKELQEGSENVNWIVSPNTVTEQECVSYIVAWSCARNIIGMYYTCTIWYISNDITRQSSMRVLPRLLSHSSYIQHWHTCASVSFRFCYFHLNWLLFTSGVRPAVPRLAPG